MTAHSLASHCRALHNIVRKSETSLSFCVVVTLSPPFSLILNGYAHSAESIYGVHLDCAFWICILMYVSAAILMCGVGANIQQGIFKCLCYCVIFVTHLHRSLGNLENNCNNSTLSMQIAPTADSSRVWD